MIIDEEVFLEHYGVKGMQWGVRRNRRANSLVKVGAGKGGKSEKVRAALTVGPIDLIKGRGLKGGAGRKGMRQLQRNARVKAGEASVSDKLKYYGGSKYQDIFPTGKAATNTKAAIGASVAGYLVFGAVMNVGKKKALNGYA